jgi:hypothetical protein
VPKSHRLPAHVGHHDFDASGEGYVLSNPLSGGELVLVGITGIIGYGIADFVGRYMSTTPVAAGGAANSIPTGAVVGNDVATAAFPSWQSMAAQFGVAAVPGIAAAFVDSPWGRAALQGMMLGAGFSLFGGLFKSLMASMIGTTALGQQLYLAESEAQAAVTAATPAAGTTTTTTTAPAATTTAAPGMAGLPRGVGHRPMLRDPGPVARGMGQSQAPPMVFAPALTSQFAPPSPGGPGNAPPPLPGGNVPTAIPQPALPTQVQIQPPGPPYPGIPGTLTNTGDVVPTAPDGTLTPGGPSTGPMCAPCTSTSGGIAATHQSAMDAIRDESCLGALPKGFGMYASFPDEAAA